MEQNKIIVKKIDGRNWASFFLSFLSLGFLWLSFSVSNSFQDVLPHLALYSPVFIIAIFGLVHLHTIEIELNNNSIIERTFYRSKDKEIKLSDIESYEFPSSANSYEPPSSSIGLYRLKVKLKNGKSTSVLFSKSQLEEAFRKEMDKRNIPELQLTFWKH